MSTTAPPLLSWDPPRTYQRVVTHQQLFTAWADCDDLEPLTIPDFTDDRDPPWQFLRRFTGTSSIDASLIGAPKWQGKVPLTLHLTVLLGVTGQQPLLEAVKRQIKADPDREPRQIMHGDCFSACVDVDTATLMPSPSSLIQSRLILLARRLAIPECALDQALRMLQADVDTEMTWLSTLPEEPPIPDEVWRRLTDRWSTISASVPGSRAFPTTKVFGQWLRAGDDPEAPGLESFFSTDLRRLAKQQPNETTRLYLSGIPRQAPPGAVDVAPPGEQAVLLPPGSGPLGRWPSARGELTTSQRVAVVRMSDRLERRTSDIVAVNGPPGSGKSTLLREFVAQQVVKRAAVIAELGPDAAFPIRHLRGRDVFSVHPDVSGFEIVVASANNGAVERVADVLNEASAVASDVPPTLLGTAGHAVDDGWWALICLVLGRRDRIRRTAELVAPWPGSGTTNGWENWIAETGLPSWPAALAAFRQAQQRVADLTRAARERGEARERLRPAAQWFDETVGGAPVDWGAHAQRWAAQSTEELNRIEQRRPGWLARQFGTRSWRHWVEEHAGEQTHLRRYRELYVAAEQWTRLDSSAELDTAAWLALNDKAERERRPPNVVPELEDARIDLFVAALRLHGSALATRSGALGQTMWSWRLAATSPNKFAAGERIALWRSLFTVVPVVTTTFASAGRMLRDFGSDGLGSVVIDEAGQSSAHYAVPLLSRARRAVIVGDPQQLEPVVVLEPELLHPVMSAAHADVRWSPDIVSVQHLADATSLVGTEIANVGTSTWVGLPLRAQFRCASPMFEVSNAISYGGQMIQMRSPDARPQSTLGGIGTTWIDAPLASGERHWGPEDRSILLSLLSEFADPPIDDELFVITPFRQAMQGARTAIGERDRSRSGDRAWASWASHHVGTIQTFQGREADTVILMLSSAAKRGRAREWAAVPPNLLNVAVTRARERLVVVGH